MIIIVLAGTRIPIYINLRKKTQFVRIKGHWHQLGNILKWAFFLTMSFSETVMNFMRQVILWVSMNVKSLIFYHKGTTKGGRFYLLCKFMDSTQEGNSEAQWVSIVGGK